MLVFTCLRTRYGNVAAGFGSVCLVHRSCISNGVFVKVSHTKITSRINRTLERCINLGTASEPKVDSVPHFFILPMISRLGSVARSWMISSKAVASLVFSGSNSRDEH